MPNTTNEVDLLVKYGGKKGGGSDGQLIIDDVELSSSRDNRVRHGIGNEDPQEIERGNKTYTFSTTCMMNEAAAQAMAGIRDGTLESKAVYVQESGGKWKDKATKMVWNDITLSSSDGGDTTVAIDADLFGLTMSGDTIGN